MIELSDNHIGHHNHDVYVRQNQSANRSRIETVS